MWLISVQYKNLGALGTATQPIQFDLQDPQLPLMEAQGKRDLPVVVIAGRNGNGKTTLSAGIYFAMRGTGSLNNRSIPRAIITNGARDMAVALTVRHSGQASKLSSKNHEYRSDRITLVRTVVVRQDGLDYAYYIVNGFYNLMDPFPLGTKVGADQYRQVLEALGVNEGVLRAYEETLEQGSVTRLVSTARDRTQLFDLLCRVAGAADYRKDFELGRRRVREGLLQLARDSRALEDKKRDLERMRVQKEHWERLVDLRADREKQVAEKVWWESIASIAQKSWRETRVAVYDRQIVEKDQEVGLLKERAVMLDQDVREADRLYREFRTEQVALEQQVNITERNVGQAEVKVEMMVDIIQKTPPQALQKSVEEWQGERVILSDRVHEASQKVKELQSLCQETEERIRILKGKTALDRFPDFVQWFSRALAEEGIAHHILADVLTIMDKEWVDAVENYLGDSRFWVMVAGGRRDFDQAYRVVEQLRYRPGIRGPRARREHSRQEYRGTVWELLDLPPKELQQWGYHLDPLGYQLLARSPEEARLLTSKRPDMQVFTPTGMVSRPDLLARSVMQDAERKKGFALYCGKRAVEIELDRLEQSLSQANQELVQAKRVYENAQRAEQDCFELLQACQAYHAAEVQRVPAEEALRKIKQERDDLTGRKKVLDEKVERQRDLKENLNLEKNNLDTKIKAAEGEVANLNNSKRGVATMVVFSLPEMATATKIKEAQDYVDQATGRVTDFGERANLFDQVYREARETAAEVDSQIQETEWSIQNIPDHERLDESILPKYTTMQTVCRQVEQALSEQRTIFQANLRTAESEYTLLHTEMTRAVQMVEQQANVMSEPLQVDFRIQLRMPDRSLFDITGDDFSAMEKFSSLENQEMSVDAQVRFERDLRREYRSISDAWASGGQREIACTALLGGILFAAQQMHAQGEIRGTDWERAPLLLLDEPFGNLDLVNKPMLIGSLLLLPVQIVVLYPAPPIAFIQAADVVISIDRSSDLNRSTELRLTRGVRTLSRRELASQFRGDNGTGLAS